MALAATAKQLNHTKFTAMVSSEPPRRAWSVGVRFRRAAAIAPGLLRAGGSEEVWSASATRTETARRRRAWESIATSYEFLLCQRDSLCLCQKPAVKLHRF